MDPRRTGEARPRVAVAVIVLAWALAVLPAVSIAPVHEAAQARAHAVAREMARGGDLVVPHYQGQVRLKKPPLASWVQAAVLRLSGSEAYSTSAFASWLLGILFALTPWLLGAALGAPRAGLLGALLLCASHGTHAFAPSAEHDVPFGAFVGAALAAGAVALAPSSRTRSSWAAGLLTGAALLVKGPFALGFVTLPLLVAARPWKRPACSGLRVVPLVVGTLAPPAAWLVLLVARLGSLRGLVDEIGRQALGGAGAHVPHGALGVLLPLGETAAALLPWLVLVLGAVALSKRRRDLLTAGSRGLRFPLLALLVGLGVLTLTPAKQAHYVIPLLPIGALLIAALLLEVRDRGGALAHSMPLGLVACAAALLASRLPGAARAGDVLGWVAVPASVLLAVAGALAAWIARRPSFGRDRALVGALVVSAALIGAAALTDARRGRLQQDYREAVAAADPSWWARDVYGYAPGTGEAFDAFALWIERPVRRLREPAEASALAEGGQPLTLVTALGNAEAVERATGGALVRLGTVAPSGATDDRHVRLVVLGRPPAK